MLRTFIIYPLLNIRLQLGELASMGYAPTLAKMSGVFHDDLVPDLPPWAKDPLGWLIGEAVDLVVPIMRAIINFMIWAFTYTPAPNSNVSFTMTGNGSNGTVNGTNSTFINGTAGSTSAGNESIFATPPTGEPWASFYGWEQNMAAIGILLLLMFWVVSWSLTGLTTFLRGYDQSHVTRRVILGIFAIYGWWYIHAAATNLANALALAIAPSASEFAGTFSETLLAVSSGALIVLVILSASLAIIGATILIYIVRIMVIYIYSFAMPLLLAMWAIDVGIFKPVHDIGKRFMRYYAPAVFFTLPAAVLLRAAQIFFSAPIQGIGSLGLACFAMALPILAIVVPKMMFSEIASIAPSASSINRKIPDDIGSEGKRTGEKSEQQQQQEFQAAQSENANRQRRKQKQRSGGSSSGPGRRESFSVDRMKRRAKRPVQAASAGAGASVAAGSAAKEKVNDAQEGKTKLQQKFGAPSPDYETGEIDGHSLGETASRMVGGSTPSWQVSESSKGTSNPGNMRQVMDRVENGDFDYSGAQYNETDVSGISPQEVEARHVPDKKTAKRMASNNNEAAVWIPEESYDDDGDGDD